jgi:hypothetical protein
VIEKPFHVESDCRKIAFIDLGASSGHACEGFFEANRVLFKSGRIQLHIHAFEPNRAQVGMPHPLRQPLISIRRKIEPHGGTAKLYSSAAWISDGAGRLKVGIKFNNTNSTMVPIAELASTSRAKFRSTIDVQCLDFSQWLKDHIISHNHDKVYVKMCIQGSEYPIIDKMISDNTLAHVDKLFIEFHERYPGVTVSESEDEYIQKMHTATSKLHIYRKIPGKFRHVREVGNYYEYVPRFGWALRTKLRPFSLGYEE